MCLFLEFSCKFWVTPTPQFQCFWKSSGPFSLWLFIPTDSPIVLQGLIFIIPSLHILYLFPYLNSDGYFDDCIEKKWYFWRNKYCSRVFHKVNQLSLAAPVTNVFISFTPIFLSTVVLTKGKSHGNCQKIPDSYII